MKKLMLLTLLSLYLLSCSKDNSNYTFEKEKVAARLQSAIFPVFTKPDEVNMGTEGAVCNAGENVSLFLPYKVVSDDVQNAIVSIKDPVTGEVIREIPMTVSTDQSVSNVIVPEELQGSTFMFATVAIENDMIGKNLTVSTKIIANKHNSEDVINNAFRVE